MYKQKILITSIIMATILTSTAITTNATNISEEDDYSLVNSQNITNIVEVENCNENTIVSTENQPTETQPTENQIAKNQSTENQQPKIQPTENQSTKNQPVENQPVENTKLVAKNDVIELCVNDKINISDIIEDYNDYEHLSYSFDNSNIIQLDKDSRELTASSIGSSILTICNESSDKISIRINVINQPSIVVLDKSKLTLGIGEEYSLYVSFNKNERTTRYKFTSTNTNVASVDENGHIKTIGVGTAAIYVRTFNNKIARCVVTVKKAPTSISLNKTNITLGIGETFNLENSLPNGQGAYSIKYSSSNSTIASVRSTSGLITAKNVGTTTITATTYNGKTINCIVTVKAAPTSISLNKTNITLGIGETFNLENSLPNGQGAYNIEYSTNDSNIASVQSINGLITANNVGTTTITATTYNGKKVNCIVNVKNAPTSISLNKTNITLGIGETFDLNSSLPSGQGAYSIKYSTNNTNIASVQSAGGLVTAKNVGTATITATTYNGKKVNCIITVKNAPTSISLNKTSLTLGIGETFDLNSSLPSGQGAYSIKYSSNNSSIANVQAAGGLVTAKNVGTAIITATTYNGKKVNCIITVKNAPTSISLNKTSLTLSIGETFDLNSSLPSGQGAYSIKYSSNNSSIANVQAAGGLVTAKSVGTATITATTYNNKKTTCTITVVNSIPITTVSGSVIKSEPSWSSKTLTTFKAGTKFDKLSDVGRWIKINYNGNVGYIYNRTFINKANCSTINEATFESYIDDWLFINGTSINTIYNYVTSMGYRSMNEGNSIRDMAIYMAKYRSGACYQRASLLYYMLDRAGYNVRFVIGKDYYTGGSPHRWCLIQTDAGWRHIDPTPVIGLSRFYLVKDSTISPYFGWNRAQYPAAI